MTEAQLALYRRHGQRTIRHPAGFDTHARAVAGKQVTGDFVLVAA